MSSSGSDQASGASSLGGAVLLGGRQQSCLLGLDHRDLGGCLLLGCLEMTPELSPVPLAGRDPGSEVLAGPGPVPGLEQRRLACLSLAGDCLRRLLDAPATGLPFGLSVRRLWLARRALAGRGAGGRLPMLRPSGGRSVAAARPVRRRPQPWRTPSRLLCRRRLVTSPLAPGRESGGGRPFGRGAGQIWTMGEQPRSLDLARGGLGGRQSGGRRRIWRRRGGRGWSRRSQRGSPPQVLEAGGELAVGRKRVLRRVEDGGPGREAEIAAAPGSGPAPPVPAVG